MEFRPLQFISVLFCAALLWACGGDESANGKTESPDPVRARVLVEKAGNLLERAEVAAAVESYRAALTADPTHPGARKGAVLVVPSVEIRTTADRLAREALEGAKKNPGSARRKLAEAHRIDPSHLGVRVLLARALARLRRFSPAAEIVSEVLELHPGWVRGAMAAAEIHHERHDWASVVRVLEGVRSKVDAGDPTADDPRYWFLLGTSLKRAIGARDPRVELERLVALAPGNIYYRDILAGLHLDNGRYAEAIEELKRCIAMAPEMARRYFDIGVAYERMGKKREAVSWFEKAGERATPDVNLHIAMARALSQTNRVEDLPAARIAVEKALKLDPDSRDALHSAAQIYRRLGNRERAEVCSKRWRTLEDANEVYSKKMLVRLDQLANKPGDVAKRIEVMEVYTRRGNLGEALRHARTLLLHDPLSLDGVFWMGELLMATGKPKEAALEARKLAQLSPDDWRSSAILAWSARARGKTDLAIREAEKVVLRGILHRRTLDLLIDIYSGIPEKSERLRELVELRRAMN